MKNFSEFERKIIDSLKESGLIERFSFVEFTQTPNIEVIEKLFKYPVKIDFDDNGIFYFNEEGEKCYCPEMYTTISDEAIWISDKLPSVDFDVHQNGNVRKADEAEALYCSLIVAHIMKEDTFKKEIQDLALRYDFDKMAPIDVGGNGFRDLLKDWQSLQSVIINILISAGRYKISDTKKDTEKYLKDGISESEAAELRDLEAKIRAINFRYSEGVLSPSEIKKLTKIERLKLINERDDEVSNLIQKTKIGTLYKILNLSSEYISPINKKKISLWVQKEVDTLIADKSFSSFAEERSQLISKFVRRALRFEKNSVRRLNVEKYIKDRVGYKLPRKL